MYQSFEIHREGYGGKVILFKENNIPSHQYKGEDHVCMEEKVERRFIALESKIENLEKRIRELEDITRP